MSIAHLIDQHVKRAPFKKALFYPSGVDALGNDAYAHLTYQQLKDRADLVAEGLRNKGVKKGTKVLLFVRPSLEFPVLAYALFKIGAVAILIDPGMGRKNLFKCIKDVAPDVLIAVPDVFIGRKLFPNVFASVKTFVMIDQGGKLKIKIAKLLNRDALNFSELESDKAVNINSETMDENDLAAIVFTSGGTGRPKGVEYNHKIYEHQVELLKSTYDLTPDDVDLPAFPLFALFTLAMGMSVVIPDMDPTKPSKACPKTLVKHINNHGVTFAGGSPAIWERVSGYCLKNNIKLSSMKSLMMFGAPVASRIHEEFSSVLENGTTFTPYGATECLPVSTISGRELISKDLTSLSKIGKGTCVGYPANGTQIKIIEPTNGIVGNMSTATILEAGGIGEIVVKGDQATKSYHQLDEKTKLAKISDDDGFWHRMGDLGYLDEHGRLWFCGRMVHSVEIENQRLCSVPTEAHFNEHPEVKRSALVNIGSQIEPKAGLVLELEARPSQTLKRELMGIAKDSNLGGVINDFYVYENFPVDIRHNIKIDRKKLGEFARAGKASAL